MDNATLQAKTVRAENGCLIWTGRTTHDGYARQGDTYVHVWVCEQANGPIPDGWEVDHLCSQPSCVEHTHLEAVTRQENMRRAGERVTSCKRGHPYTPENTYVQKGTGRKSCKECRTAAYRTFLDKNPHYHRDRWREGR